MSDVTIKQLAGVLGMSVDKLLVQLDEAGMKFSGPEQVVSSTQKVKLLGFLRRTHGKGEKAAQKPWEAAEGLEWEVPSPAPFHTFENPPKLNSAATKVIG